MPAMHDEVFTIMDDNIEKKKRLMLRLYPFSMKYEEALSLVAPKEHVALLLAASRIADIPNPSPFSMRSTHRHMQVQVPAYMDDTAGAKVQFTLRTHDHKEPPLIPLNPAWQLPETPEQVALGERVIQWAEKRIEVGRRFAMLRHVLRELNRNCTSGSQLTYLMPTISHLCERGRSTRMDTWLDRFGAFKPVKNAPALSLEMRKATGEAASLLTSVAMLGDDVPEPEEGEVAIDIYSMPSFKFEGEFIRRL
jgi:hypothetical protein